MIRSLIFVIKNMLVNMEYDNWQVKFENYINVGFNILNEHMWTI